MSCGPQDTQETPLRFSGNIDLIILNTKELLPILEEPNKIFRNVDFIMRPDVANREAGTHGLVYPQQVRNISPGVRIRRWLVSPGLPQNRSILLKEADEGTAARSAIDPDGDFVDRRLDRRFKDEE